MFWYYLAQTLLVIAVVMFGLAIYGFVDIQYTYRTSAPVEGTIVSVRAIPPVPMSLRSARFWNSYSTTYAPTFAYRFDDKDYEVEADFASIHRSEYSVGAKRTLYVDAARPDRFLSGRFSEVYGLVATWCFFGVLLLFFWFPLRFVFGVYDVESIASLEELRTRGTRIHATVTLVERSLTADMEDSLSEEAQKFIKETKVDPWTVYAEWQSPKDGKTYQFQSRGLEARPKVHKGETVDVYIEIGKPQKYFMDLSRYR